MKRIIKRMTLGVISIVLIIVGVFIFSPRPITWIVKQSFVGGNEVAAADFDEAKQKTTMEADINYGPKFPNSTLDIIHYKGDKQNIPTIFWIHGGAFVGGDKADVLKYATYIASNGFNVVNINYGLAPNVSYPVPLQQIDQAYRFIKKNAKQYGLDISNIYVAGDSAGAQLAAQFTSIQMNEGFSDSAKIGRSIPPETIRGVILLCGPYDLQEVATMSPSAFKRFLFKRIGWSYFGKYNWEGKQATLEASLLKNVPKAFVPTFITDGNTASFEAQGKRFAKLLEKRTTVTQVFYDTSKGTYGHEYQFQMNLDAAQNTFKELLKFLEETKSSAATKQS
ncbi:alpha/beta hydrolase [Ectobacillus sp. JY-23]|uniref:alpha/beta hydrolase n=1 Tax=Ectobacillus sp. JY-23 TaxID=2933872 RepID=UPI001FF4A4CB|nr:alpha/beta hydrolase [Ectobacillus sp. JY-23]UOY92012.1 alpha/beta hydrolase [Ectobacillus sp. JY-23]